MPIVDDKLKLVQNAATFEGLFNAVSDHPSTGTKFFKDDLTWDVIPKQFQSVVTVAKEGHADFVCSDAVYGGDDTACIRAVLNSVPSGSTIVFFEGVYTVTSIIAQTGKNLNLIGIGDVYFNCSGGGADIPVIQLYGSVRLTTTLSANADISAESVVLTSATDVQNDDLILIYNDDLWCPDDYATQKTGEMYEVSGVSGTTITLSQLLLRSYLASNSHVEIYKPITINIKNIKFAGTGSTDNVFGMKLQYCINSKVEKCTFTNHGRRTLMLHSCYNTIIEESHISNSCYEGSGYGIGIADASAIIYISKNVIQNCRHCIMSGTANLKGLNRAIMITGNTLIGGAQDGGDVIDSHQTTIDYTVTNNKIYPRVHVTEVPGFGFYAFNDGTKQSIFSHNYVFGGGGVCRRGKFGNRTTIITDNILEHTNGAPLYEYSIGTIGNSMIINNNHVTGCTFPSDTYGTCIEITGEAYNHIEICNNVFETCSVHGISFHQATGVSIGQCMIQNNIISNVGGNAIYVSRKDAANILDYNICGNIITNTGGKGIYIIDTDQAMVAGNTIRNAYDGIRESTTLGAADNNRICDNILSGCSHATILRVGSHTTTLNNDGYNPVGNFTAPVLPASNVAYTNSYGYPCMVSISGGTVSAISIDGVNTGHTSDTVILSPGETIAITYSSAPTWKWWGL